MISFYESYEYLSELGLNTDAIPTVLCSPAQSSDLQEKIVFILNVRTPYIWNYLYNILLRSNLTWIYLTTQECLSEHCQTYVKQIPMGKKHNHYENTPIQIYWKFYNQKGTFSDKNILIFFHISAQNIDCRYSLEPPRQGGANEYPQSMFLNRNKKNNVYPCKPQFYYIKVGFKGVKIYRRVFVRLIT